MLRREPVIEVKDRCACCGADPPGEVSVQRRRTDDVSAAMKMQYVDVAACLRDGDPHRIHAVRIDGICARSLRRAGYDWLQPLQVAADRRNWQIPALRSLLEQAQGEPQCFHSEAHELPSVIISSLVLGSLGHSVVLCSPHHHQQRVAWP